MYAAQREFERRLLTSDGDEVWVSLTISTLFDEGARPNCFLVQAQNNRQRKKAEAALRHKKRSLAP